MPKKIIVLADGTGNSFFTQESNVWRIYQALDISSKEQIASYIPGVGTQSIPLLAYLDGATGLGVPSNVQRLYQFLCWNWEPGDEIYMFGFSRGAFTIRTLIDLVRVEGLLPDMIGDEPVTRAQMQSNVKAAWRSYCRKDPIRNQNLWVCLGVRWLRDAILGLGRRLSGEAPYGDIVTAIAAQGRRGADVPIGFVGLFDTVEAYGVPLEELRMAVHLFVWPIAFGNDHKMSGKVQGRDGRPRPQVGCVRHALSLDDERTTFHPIRIDTTDEDKNQAPGRIEEVWFSGVHSDVGGGYPDASLAHAPLVWMLEEAKKAGVVLRDGELERFDAMASAFGPSHDSRAGAGVFYRYHPRVIEDESSKYGRPAVHYTVVERIVGGDDDYAPISLPERTDVYMPDGSYFTHFLSAGFQRAQPASAANAASASAAPLIEARMQTALAAIEELHEPPNKMELDLALDFVWWRRVNYFALVGLLALLVLFPFVGGPIAKGVNYLADRIGLATVGDRADTASDGVANVFSSLAETAQKVLPPYLAPYAKALHEHPWIGVTLILTFIALLMGGGKLRDKIHDHACNAWNVEDNDSDDERSGRRSWRSRFVTWFARAMRTRPASKAGYRWSQPILTFAWFVFLFLAPVSVAVNRVAFDYLVGSGKVCIGSDNKRYLPNTEPLRWIRQNEVVGRRGYSEEQPDGFATNNPCWASRWGVERGVAYRLFIEIDAAAGEKPWFDQLILADVNGFESDNWVLGLATSLRRWWSAPWFHPIARIGDTGEIEWPLVPNDGARPISGQAKTCPQKLVRYDETQEHKRYCDTAMPAPSTCGAGGIELECGEPLPVNELASANAAWERRKQDAGNCPSLVPRRRFVSDFVARETGELFLFVNDAARLAFDDTPQEFYRNNRGTATITLQRPPLPEAPKAK